MTTNTNTNTTPGTGQRPLAALFPPDAVRASLLPREAWQPIPPYADRAAWQGLPGPIRRGLRDDAEEHLHYEWPSLPATRFLDYARDGNRSRYEAVHFARRRALLALLLGECTEGKGRYLDDIADGVWTICEESFWGVPAHNYSLRPPFESGRQGNGIQLGLPDTAYRVVDLFAAETGALVAWVWYLLREQLAGISPVIPDRIEREMRERILQPYRTVDFHWYGERDGRPPNNWNPWIHSNILAVNLLMEPDAEARATTVDRAITGLDTFLSGYHPDGGCDEGASYWDRAGGSLFDCLDLLHDASGGTLDAFGLPLVGEIGAYIYRMHIGGAWYVNFADGAARLNPDGDTIRRYGVSISDEPPGQPGQPTQPMQPTRPTLGRDADTIRRYGGRTGDPLLIRQGTAALDDIIGIAPPAETDGNTVRAHELDAALFHDAKHIRSGTRRLRVLFGELVEPGEDRSFPLVREAWLPGVEALTAREDAGSVRGLFLAAKGGHNAESHNHNDVGQFIVGVDGRPVLIDLGVGEYTRFTFGPERYGIFTMQSEYHNLPVVNGVGQSPGREFAARDVSADVSDAAAGLSLDIAGAYPPEAGIEVWRRAVRLDRARPGEPSQIVLRDEYRLSRPPQSLVLHLLTAGEVAQPVPGALILSNATRPLLVQYDPRLFSATLETIPIDDRRLTPVWGDHVTRIALTMTAPAAEGAYELRMRIRK